jgi:tetratricopeptide (TPR) repeat protein
MYLIHNYQFLAFAAAMDGRRADTVGALRAARAATPDAMLLAMPGFDWSIGFLYDGFVRFGMWDKVLTEPAPNAKLDGLTISYHQARATALAALGRVSEAKAEAAIAAETASKVSAEATQGMNAAQPLYGIGQRKAEARIALAEGKTDRRLTLLREAVALEDELAYNEPEDVFFPARHLLGAALIDAKRPGEAEAVYREDLRRHPNNGWALTGLMNAQKAMKQSTRAAEARRELKKAWSRADMKVAKSAF